MTTKGSVGFTAGPWRVEATDTLLTIRSAGGINVAATSWHSSIRKPYPLKPEAQANATLISAAPDFFQAATRLLEAWDARTTGAQQIVTGKSDRDIQKQAQDALEELRAAVAKASPLVGGGQ